MDLITKLVNEFDKHQRERLTESEATRESIVAGNFMKFAHWWLLEHPVQGIGRGENGETLLIDGDQFDIQPAQRSNMQADTSVPVTQPQEQRMRSHPQDMSGVPVTGG